MKITKELYTKIKYEVTRFPLEQVAVNNSISKRTARNIGNTNNYTEYRQKFCSKKQKQENNYIDQAIEKHELYIMDSILCLTESIEADHKLINKLIFIDLLVSVIGLSIIIAMIAW